MNRFRTFTVILTAFCILSLQGCSDRSDSSDLNYTDKSTTDTVKSLLGNYDEVVDSVRGALVRYSSCITVRFKSDEDISSELLHLADELMVSAMDYTDNPVEGDYIRYQTGGYESSYTIERTETGWNNALKIVPKYYSYLEYEEKVTEKVREIISGFGFDENTSDYDKVRTVYDYVCRNVTYDRIHVRNDNYYLRSTSYAALIWGNATCQGYCVTIYRLLREVGINCRIVTGKAEGESSDNLHAWNIIELDEAYYCSDATWDAGKESYDYFLKGSSEFTDHTPGAGFTTSDFMSAYPIAEKSYRTNERKNGL